MPLITLPPDQTGDDIKFVADTSKAIGDLLSDCITRVVARISPRNSEFFGDSRIGTNGVRLPTTLGAHVQFIATHYPEKMNATLMKTGRYLNPHQDGTVTYDPPPEITSPATLNGVVGEAFSHQVTAVNDVTSYSAEGLPEWLSMDADGLITGTPTEAGAFEFTITVSGFGDTEQEITLTVSEAQEENPE